MKKFGFLLTGLALLAASLAGIRVYESKRLIDVFSRAQLKQEIILGQGQQLVFKEGSGWQLDASKVQVLQGKVQGDKEKALKDLVEETLQKTHHKSWLADAVLQADYLFANIYKDAKDELILTVNRSKDLAMVFVFAENREGYDLVTRLRGLAPVTSLAVVGIPGFPYKGLVLEEYLDEMTGGFFEAKTKSVYLFTEGRLHKAWERISYLKEYYPQGGQLKGDQTQWWLNEEKVEVTFSDRGQITASGKRTEEKAKILGEMAGPYEVINEREINEKYHWDAKELKFKLIS